jgi:hypothetical protein
LIEPSILPCEEARASRVWWHFLTRFQFHTTISPASYVARLARRSRFDDGIAAIMERRRSLTISDDPKISATSGSSTIATVPLDIFAANRFGFDLL